MKSNVGNIDRAIRIVVGFVLLSLLFVLDDVVRWISLIGVVPLITGLAGRCPGYVPFGIDTREQRPADGTDR